MNKENEHDSAPLGELTKHMPDILEALKRVLAEKAPAYHDCIDNGESECAWCAARAAIAKAEGGAA